MLDSIDFMTCICFLSDNLPDSTSGYKIDYKLLGLGDIEAFECSIELTVVPSSKDAPLGCTIEGILVAAVSACVE